MLWFFLSLLFLILAAWIFIQTPWGQNWIIGRVTKKLSKELITRISINNVSFSLFNSMHLEGLLIEDRKRDTLLYAGIANVRITDWFFFKDEIVLKYIGLEDATVNFNRTDSVWNNQFLFDYLSTPSSKKSNTGGINLNLKKVELKNIRFIKSDKWLGQDLTLRVSKLNLDARDMNLKTKNIEISLIEISEPYISIYDYKRLKPTLTNVPVVTPVIDSLSKWNADGWTMQLDKLVVENGLLNNEKQIETPLLSGFDGRHIFFNEINGTFTNVKWRKDTITAKVNFKTKERSGLEVKKMIADVKFTPQLMEFSKLDLHTNRSRIGDYYAMSFDNFNDLGYYISRVKMTGDFKNTEISSDDIAFFAPGMKNWKKNIIITGKVKGTVEDLNGKNLFITAGNNTLLNGDISLSGLPNINTTFIDFKSNEFKTTYADAAGLFPSLKKISSPRLSSIQYINFKGNFTGFIRDFVTLGTIQTNLGTITTDLNMKLPKGKAPVYSGNIATTNFNLGLFLGEKNMGFIAFNAKVNGSGFNKKINVDIDGKINQFVYNGYHYEEISVKGKLIDKFFSGNIISNDSNAVFTAKGTVDFNQKKPILNLEAEIQDIQFQKLRIGKQNYVFSGRLNFDFQGDNIDDFLGTARIQHGILSRDSLSLSFDSLILRSTIVNGEKKLSVSSDEFDGTVTGQFNIDSLPNAITLFLNKYYPSYISEPKNKPVTQNFGFDFNTRNIDAYLKMLDVKLNGFDGSHLDGKINLAQNQLELNATVPYFTVNQFVFNDSKLKGTGTREKLLLTGRAGSTKINDSISLKATDFTIESTNDISKVKIVTASNRKLNSANINATVTTFNDGVKIKFDSSYFDVNSKTWSIEQNGELEFRSNTVANGELTLREGVQEIKLSTEPSTDGNHNDLRVVLKNLNLGDIAPFVLPKNAVEGMASGTILIDDPAKKFNVKSNLNLQKLKFDDDSIGNMKVDFDYNNTTGLLTANGINDDPVRKIDFDMLWHLKKDSTNAENYIVLSPENYPIKILNRFLGTLFTDIQGYATGKIKIGGPGNTINYTGKAKLHDAGLKVIFTQCFYKIEDTEIELKETEIDLTGIILKDTATGNPIYVNGTIMHSSFANLFLDIGIQTRKPFTSGKNENRPVLLLNTTYNDNKQFYGKAYGTGSLQLLGKQNDLNMQISAIASEKDSSFVTIPPSRSRESGEASFLVERQYGREMNADTYGNRSSNIFFDADITANPAVTMKVQIDDLTQDEIVGRGEGTLNIRSGTNEPLSIRGRYKILEGKYDYSFQSIFKKPFILKKGLGVNNYIEWFGDPYKAKINFEATYTAENVSFTPLVEDFSLDKSLSGLRSDVIVSATMYNELFDPRFNFKIELPENSEAKRNQSLAFNLAQIEKNQNELTRQVAFLIVTNSFAPRQNSANPGLTGAFNELLYNSISGILFTEINNIFNNILYKIFKTDKVRLDISGSLYNRNILYQTSGGSSLTVNQGNVKVNLPVSLLKGRLIFNPGLSSEISLGSGAQTLLYKNFSLDLLINPSGSLRATVFYRENPDLINQSVRATRQGAGFSYRREANRFWDLFGLGKKNNPQPIIIIPKPVTDSMQTELKILN